ncbi:MAG: acyltransferase domain-containing protein [Acidimicrobiales bacterium]
MTDVVATIASMRAFLPSPRAVDVDRVARVTSLELGDSLRELNVAQGDADEIIAQWDVFRADESWMTLLAALVSLVEQQMGDHDAPLPVWDDLDDAGASGRLLYYYLFAITWRDTQVFLREAGCPNAIIERTMSWLSRHTAIHVRKWDTVGLDAGWWMLPTLRGELLHVGSLQFHRVTLGVGSLAPRPWYNEYDAKVRGPGFRYGDASVGIHIPDKTDLSKSALDATFDEARDVIGALWPVHERRIATCQSWMLDSQLEEFLAPSSNILEFQRRFAPLPEWIVDDGDIVEFVFRRPGVALRSRPQTTTLERAVVTLIESGRHWRVPPCWTDFDGI